MPYCSTWEEFAKSAERLYISDPMKENQKQRAYSQTFGSSFTRLIVRFTMKYRHIDGKLVIKLTDNHTCLMYLTEHTQDVKKLEKLTSQLMRHMASKEK